jgi:hypothetical protein
VARQHARRMYQGAIGADRTLHVRRGAWVRVTDAEGNVLADAYEPRRRLVANLGDRFVLSAADLASNAIGLIEVASIDAAGNATVRVLRGELPIGEVRILPGRLGAPMKRRPPARRPLALPGAQLAELVRRRRLALVGADTNPSHMTKPRGFSSGPVEIPDVETSHAQTIAGQ